MQNAILSTSSKVHPVAEPAWGWGGSSPPYPCWLHGGVREEREEKKERKKKGEGGLEEEEEAEPP